MAPMLLSLPAELRLQIYGNAFERFHGFSFQHQLSPLLVCKQMREEALPVVIAEKSKNLSSAEKLIDWIDGAPRQLLPAIRHVSFSFGKGTFSQMRGEAMSTKEMEYFVSLLPEVDRSPMRMSLKGSMFSFWADECVVPAGSILEKLLFCFHAIKRTRKIWVQFDNDRFGSTDIDYTEQQQVLLDMMSITLPEVRDLSVFSNLVCLDFLSRFRQLRQLRITGYSRSTPDELLEILNSLHRLDSLILYRYPKLYDNGNRIVTEDLPFFLSLTPEVLTQMNPLSHVSIVHMERSLPSSFLTVDWIEALHAHTSRLESLRIFSDHEVDEECFWALWDLIMSASTMALKHIDLNFQAPESCVELFPTELFPHRTDFNPRSRTLRAGDISCFLNMKDKFRRRANMWANL